MKWIGVLAVLAAVVWSGLAVGTAGAAQGEGFSLSPLSFETVLAPGETNTVTMTVRNVGTENLSLRIYACDVQAAAEAGGAVVYVPADDPEATGSLWYTVEPAWLTLAAGEQQSVDVRVTVPEDAAGGTYCGAVFAETVPDAGGAARVGNRIGMLTYLSVGRKSGEPVAVQGVRVRNWWRTSPRVEVVVFNPGPIHQTVQGQIDILQGNRLYATIDVPRIILQPDETRTLVVPWLNPPRWGRFDLTVNMQGNGDVSSRGAASCILFPLASAAGLLLMIAAAGLFREKKEDPLQRLKKPGR